MHKIIVIMGGQGVGKGTISHMLCERGDYKYIETGEMLRAAPADSPIGQRIARGELVPDTEICAMIGNEIDCGRDVVLDGFPRTRVQSEWLVNNFAQKFDIRIVYMAAPREVMIERIQKRIRTVGGRADDADIAAVERRINTFFDTTMPAIEWLRHAAGVHFAEIDGTGTIDENFNATIAALEK